MIQILFLFALALASNPEGLKFLEENKEKEGVVELPSGLQYKVLRAGDGDSHPTKDSPCECHYAGTLIDGTEFDSSYKRGSPTTFAPNQVISGWTEAMQLMVEGDKWEMYIPSDLGYGDGGSGDKIKGGDVLVFRMEILKIKGGKKKAVHCNFKSKENCDPEELTVLEEWGQKSVEELDKKMKELDKRLQDALKKEQREQAQLQFKTLKAIK